MKRVSISTFLFKIPFVNVDYKINLNYILYPISFTIIITIIKKTHNIMPIKASIRLGIINSSHVNNNAKRNKPAIISPNFCIVLDIDL